LRTTNTRDAPMRQKKQLKPLEKNFKAYVLKRLKAAGIYHFVKEAAALRGIPDIIGSCLSPSGKFFGWELKRSKDEVYYKSKKGMKLTGRTALQWHNIQKIRKSGGIGEFVYPENFEEKFQELLNG